MSKTVIWAPSTPVRFPDSPKRSVKVTVEDVSASSGSTMQLSVGDRLFVLSSIDDEFEKLEPSIFVVTESSSKFLKLSLAASHANGVPADRLRNTINRGLSAGINVLSESETSAILAAMGPVKISESEMLDHVRQYIRARGYYFDDETVLNYHICLKTRPFVILAGLSGTGKSKLSQLYAESIGHTVQNGRYLRLAVRPSWNDDRYLLGYLNTITGDYISEPALDFVTQAEADRRNLYFFCLDEMNLAHVEYYFSQFLSAMEEESPADRRLLLFSESTGRRLAEQQDGRVPERVVLLPTNLLFTGTINVDETTQPISDKVVDRANTLEFFTVDLDKIPDRQPPSPVIEVSADLWNGFRTYEPDTQFRQQLVEIGAILNRAGMGLGYRVVREIEMYLANSHDLLPARTAFDFQIKQRILPRVRGTLTLEKTLTDLTGFMKQNNYAHSAQRLDEMVTRLKRDGYTSFWR
ncbi:MAG: hypothetical protein M9936_28380 [Caldilinea sp.]|nr:hypothetical protein [Caldilinea sp.]